MFLGKSPSSSLFASVEGRAKLPGIRHKNGLGLFQETETIAKMRGLATKPQKHLRHLNGISAIPVRHAFFSSPRTCLRCPKVALQRQSVLCWESKVPEPSSISSGNHKHNPSLPPHTSRNKYFDAGQFFLSAPAQFVGIEIERFCTNEG